MNEAHFMGEVIEAKRSILITVAWSRKAQLAYLFENWALSQSVYKDMFTMGPAFHFSYAIVPSSFFTAVASFSRYEQTGIRKHLKAAKSFKKKLEGVAAIGSPNAIPFLAFLDAEALAITSIALLGAVMASYDEAISVMATHNLVHMEGFANERAGFCCARQHHIKWIR